MLSVSREFFSLLKESQNRQVGKDMMRKKCEHLGNLTVFINYQ